MRTGRVLKGFTLMMVVQGLLGGTYAQTAPTPAACALTVPAGSPEVNVVSYRFAIMDFYSSAVTSCNGQGLTVRATVLPFEAFNTQINTALAAGGSTSYQVVHASPRLIGEWAGKGWLLPLNSLIRKYRAQYDLGDISPGLWNASKVGSQTYGVPMNFNTQIVFYRKDIFDELGLKPPSTFAEYVSTLEALKKAGKTKYPSAIAFKDTSLSAEFHNNLMAFGGKWFDKSNKPTFNSAAGLKAAQALQTWVQYMPPSVLSYSNDDVMVALQQGDIAISKIWLTRATNMEDTSVSKVVGKIEFAPAFSATTKGPVASTVSGDYFVIPAGNKGARADIAFRAIMEAAERPNQLKAAQLGMVSRVSVAGNADLIKKNRAWPAAIENAKRAGDLQPKVSFFGIANTIVSKKLAQAISEKGDLQKALDEAASDVEKELKAQGVLK